MWLKSGELCAAFVNGLKGEKKNKGIQNAERDKKNERKTERISSS